MVAKKKTADNKFVWRQRMRARRRDGLSDDVTRRAPDNSKDYRKNMKEGRFKGNPLYAALFCLAISE